MSGGVHGAAAAVRAARMRQIVAASACLSVGRSVDLLTLSTLINDIITASGLPVAAGCSHSRSSPQVTYRQLKLPSTCCCCCQMQTGASRAFCAVTGHLPSPVISPQNTTIVHISLPG